MPEPHDFAEHGRLHLLRALCGELEDMSAMQYSIRIMQVRHSLEPAVDEAERIVAAYRAVVQSAAEALAWFDEQQPNGGGIVREELRASLAAFRNIGGAP